MVARYRMRLHVPGEWYYCSRVLAWTIGVALLDWPGKVDGLMAALTWPEILQGDNGKEWFIEHGISLQP
jgi:hypothetical protein